MASVLSPDDAVACGSQLLWVIGRDKSKNREVTCGWYGYNGYGPARPEAIWGCQVVEVWAVECHRRLGNLAVRHEVKVFDMLRLGKWRLTGQKVLVFNPFSLC